MAKQTTEITQLASGPRRKVRRIIKVRVGDTFEGTFIRLLSQTKEPQMLPMGWIEYMYIEVEQDAT